MLQRLAHSVFFTSTHCHVGSDVSVPAPVNTSHNQPWTDIDAADCDDQLACTDYVHDIVQNLLSAEVRHHIMLQLLQAI